MTRFSLYLRITESTDSWYGLITVDHLAVQPRYGLVKNLRVLQVLLGVVILPVDNNIDAFRDRGVHDLQNPGLHRLRVIQVAVRLDAHGRTDHLDLPVLGKPPHSAGREKGGARPKRRGGQGHSSQPHWRSICVHEPAPLHPQLAMLLHHGRLPSPFLGKGGPCYGTHRGRGYQQDHAKRKCPP